MPAYGSARPRHAGLVSLIACAVVPDASNGASQISWIISTPGFRGMVPFLPEPVAGSNRGHATTYVELGSDPKRDADHSTLRLVIPRKRAFFP